MFDRQRITGRPITRASQRAALIGATFLTLGGCVLGVSVARGDAGDLDPVFTQAGTPAGAFRIPSADLVNPWVQTVSPIHAVQAGENAVKHLAAWRRVGTDPDGTPSYGMFLLRDPNSRNRQIDTGVRSDRGVRGAAVAYHRRHEGFLEQQITIASTARDSSNRPVIIVRRVHNLFSGDPVVDPNFGAGGSGQVSVIAGAAGATAKVTDIVVSETAPYRVFVGYTTGDATANPSAVVLSLTSAGALDTSFGGGSGLLTLSSSRLAGIEELADGRLVAATNRSDSGGFVAFRLTQTGAITASPTFSGRQVHAISAFPANEVVVGDPHTPRPQDGGYAVLTGPVASVPTDVEYRKSDGSRPGGFGTSSLGRQPLPTTNRRYAAITAADDGYAYVGGEEFTGGSSKPRLTRIAFTGTSTSAGSSSIDETFGPAYAPACTGATGSMSYSSIVLTSRRVFSLALCGDGFIEVTSAFEVDAFSNLEVRVYTQNNAAGRERIRASSLTAANALQQPEPESATVDSTPLRNIPLRNIPLRNIPLRNIPLRNIPLRNIPLRNIPLRNIPLRNIPLRNIPLRNIPLRNIPLRNIGGLTIEQLLAGSTFEGASLDDVSFGDLLDLNTPEINALAFADFDFSETALANLTIVSLLLAPIPLDSLPAPIGGWCALLGLDTSDCGDLDTRAATLLDLELAGYDLNPYYALPIPITADNVRASDLDAPLGLVRLQELNFDETSFGEIQGSSVQSLLQACRDRDTDCDNMTLSEIRQADPPSFGDSTVGDLIRLLPASGSGAPDFPDDLQFPLVLAEIIGGIIDPGYYALEGAPLSNLLDAADIRTVDLVDYRVQVDADCSQAAYGSEFTMQISPGSRIVPGSAFIYNNADQTNAPIEPTVSPDGVFRLASGAGLCITESMIENNASRFNLSFSAEPGVVLGPEAAAVGSVAGPLGGTPEEQGPDGNAIDDSHDPGDTPGSARSIDDGDLYTGHLSNSDDVDWFELTSTRADTTITLTHLPGDADIAVYGPDPTGGVTPGSRTGGTLRGSAEARDPSVAADDVGDLGDSHIQPDAQQDVTFPATAGGDVQLGVSARRGNADERIEIRPSQAGRPLRIAVRGHAGEDDALPYVLRATSGTPLQAPECISRPNGDAPTQNGAFPNLPLASSTKTLILVNRGRTAARFGAAATASMMNALSTYASRSEVQGVIVPIESDPQSQVGPLYTSWDANPCTVETPQKIALEITKTIDRASSGLPDLRHVILVGSDDILPQVRVPDRTVYSNEAKYADEATVGGKETSISSALRGGYLLSDDPYGDFDPESYRGGLHYVPDVGTGRLVESPDDVVGQLQQYAAANGRLDIGTAYVSGYDFLKDGATEIADGLASAAATVERQINDDFDTPELARSLGLSGPGVSSVNAHFSHTAAISAAAERGKRYGEVVNVADVTPGTGRLLLTIGCHSGLNDPDSALASGGVMDWAQKAGRSRTVLVANTGFGYGDTAAVAYSEKLAAALADQIASGKVTIGQALLFAKQQYGGELLERTDYDVKASEEHTLYGLPTYKIGPAGTEAPAVIPSASAITGSGASTVRSSQITITSNAQRHDSPEGTFYNEPGEDPIVVSGRPIQPGLDRDVTPVDGTRTHGALLTALSSHNAAITPRVSRPVIDHSEQEPAPPAGDVVFPTSLTTLQTISTPQGLRDRLSVATGQFISSAAGTGPGTQRFFDSISIELLRSSSADFTPPDIDDVSSLISSNRAAFSASTTATDTSRGLVLYQDDATDAWHSTDLQPGSPGQWGALVTLAPGATRVRSFIVQLADAAGNVGTASDKRSGFSADPTPAAGPQDPKIQFVGSLTSGGVYRDSVSARLASGDPTDNVTYRIDGGDPQTYTGQFFVSNTEGIHSVEVTRAAPGGRRHTATSYALLDTRAPSVVGHADRDPDVVHTETSGGTTVKRAFYTSPVRVNWTCADAGSGVQTCPAPVSTTGEGPAITMGSGSAVDNAGHSGTGTFGPMAIDQAAPNVGFTNGTPTLLTPGIAPVSGVTVNRLSLVASDNVSGIAEAPTVTFTPILPGAATTVDATTVSCTSAERRSCSYRVTSGFPGLGAYEVTAGVVDRVGRRRTSAAIRIVIVSVP